MSIRATWETDNIEKGKIDTIQLNLGNRCNQICSHCHIAASPRGNCNMDYGTAKKILNSLINLDVINIEFTGGAPELNPNLKYFIEGLSRYNKNLTVRTNLTVLDSPDYLFYIELYKKHNVKIIASLPGVFEDTVDKQRGKGVFERSITVIQRLNEIGYATDGLYLDLVYNPSSDFLPPTQEQLEGEYKQILKEKYNIAFNNLITIVNSPIGRFKRFLKRQDRLYDYMELLKREYNPITLNNIMCRHLISIDYEGYIYDCDFNLAMKKGIRGYEDVKFWEIDFSNFSPLITFGEYCLACTADMGSSCHGSLINEDREMTFDVKESVKIYYGKELQKTSDLKAKACCTPDEVPDYINKTLSLIHDEIKMKYYGCGSPIPLCVEGLRVLDVGCGTGRDVYIMSKLAGEKGFIYGMDMTENQIDIAKKYVKEQTKRFDYKKPNVEFILDYIENIERYFKEEAIDLVISNCVINLAEDKEIVLRQIFNILKYGGELYFSDIYSDRRSPDDIKNNPILYSECLGGALYFKDFERISRKIGFIDPRVVSKREINITNQEIKDLIGNIKFYSITYRLWKLKGLDDACEDYGHIVIYRGGVEEAPFKFELDDSHVFYKNKPERVCGNTALMLSETRFKRCFKIMGSFKEHFGEFKECSNNNKEGSAVQDSGSCLCY